MQEFVCKPNASQTSFCKASDLRYQLVRVKKGGVDSSQLPPCQDTLGLCFMLCSLIIKHAYGNVHSKPRGTWINDSQIVIDWMQGFTCPTSRGGAD